MLGHSAGHAAPPELERMLGMAVTINMSPTELASASNHLYSANLTQPLRRFPVTTFSIAVCPAPGKG
jgi:hypothetical protein